MATFSHVNDEALHFLNVNGEVKEKLRLLLNESNGVLVQRVSRSVMVVKCQVTPKHPLGYLHLTFLMSKGKDVFDKYLCTCDYKGNVTINIFITLLLFQAKCKKYNKKILLQVTEEINNLVAILNVYTTTLA